jgi:hypothetical protein
MEREKQNMGFIYTEITLENPTDVANARDGFIKESEIRRATVKALVDTGATTLVIGEKLCGQLGLGKWFPGQSKLAGGGSIDSFYACPVGIYWKDRMAARRPLVVPEQEPALMGALALEDLDLIPDPKNETLVGRHGDKPVSYIM